MQQHALSQHQFSLQQLSAGLVPQPLPPAGAGAGSVAPRRWFKYHMQRVLTATTSQVLFFLVDASGRAKLAVTGTDIKSDGHFVYASEPDVTEAPPLRCTNRQQVLSWLAALGGMAPADEFGVVLPQAAAPHAPAPQDARPSGPLRPRLDKNYNQWREHKGDLPDGRHFRRFYLTDSATGAERLAVEGQDTHKQDRRYHYKAADDLGGAALSFENGRVVVEWLDWVVGAKAEPPASMRGPVPDARAKTVAKRRGKQAQAQAQAQASQQAGDSGSGDSGLADAAAPAPAAAPAAAAAAGAQAGGMAFGGQHFYTPERLLPPWVPGGYSYAQPSSGYGAPPPAAPAAAWQQQQQQALLPSFPPQASGFALNPYAPQQQHALSLPSPLQQLGAIDDAAEMRAAVAAAGEEVRQLFAGAGQGCLEFVTGVPDEQSLLFVREMARRLRTFLANVNAGLGDSASTVTAAEVIGILRFLAERGSSLKLLEASAIGHAVMLLSCMDDRVVFGSPEAAGQLQQVRQLAASLAGSWWDLTTLAARVAEAALGGGAGGVAGGGQGRQQQQHQVQLQQWG